MAKAVKGAKVRSTRARGVVVAPTNLMRLIELVGPARAARELGTAPTTLHRARRANEVSQVIEVAAGSILKGLGIGTPAEHHASEMPPAIAKLLEGADSATVTFLLTAPRSKAEIVEQFAQAIGAKLIAA